MSDQLIEFPKRREIPEVISDSFKFIGSESGALLKYTLIYALPFIVVLAALQLVLTSEVTAIQETLRNTEPSELLGQVGGMYKKYFLILLFNVPNSKLRPPLR